MPISNLAPMVTVTGAAELSAKLAQLANQTAPKAAIAGTRAALRELAKGIRAAINTTDAPSDIKRKARKSIGHRYGKSKAVRTKGVIQAKAGYAVGKPRSYSLGAHQSRGVGMGVWTVHWFVFGVEDHGTTERHHESGHSTGKMQGDLAGTVQAGTAASAQLALNAARVKITQTIMRAAKRGRRK